MCLQSPIGVDGLFDGRLMSTRTCVHGLYNGANGRPRIPIVCLFFHGRQLVSTDVQCSYEMFTGVHGFLNLVSTDRRPWVDVHEACPWTFHWCPRTPLSALGCPWIAHESIDVYMECPSVLTGVRGSQRTAHGQTPTGVHRCYCTVHYSCPWTSMSVRGCPWILPWASVQRCHLMPTSY